MKKGMPTVGEKIKTPDGMAVVTDVNILENIIKTRLVLEEGKNNEKEEKQHKNNEINKLIYPKYSSFNIITINTLYSYAGYIKIFTDSIRLFFNFPSEFSRLI
jgi:hypothetical protein